MSAPGPLFVIGAGPGIGSAVARRFALAGHPVGLVARNKERLETTTQQLRDDAGVHATYALADVRDPAAVHEAIDALHARLGSAEALCVSPLPDTGTIKPVEQTTAEDLSDALALGIVGTADQRIAAADAVHNLLRQHRAVLRYLPGQRQGLDDHGHIQDLRRSRLLGRRIGRMSQESALNASAPVATSRSTHTW